MPEQRYIKRERKIYVGDMLWYALKGWRLLIVAMILCAVVGGAIGYKNSDKVKPVEKETTAGETEAPTEPAPAQKELTQADIDLVGRAINVKTQVDDLNNYINTSDVLNMDAGSVHRILLQYYVITDSFDAENGRDYASDLLNGYSIQLATSSELYEAVNEKLGGTINPRDMGLLVGTSISNSVITITLRGSSDEMCTSILECVETAMDEIHTALTTSVGAHKLTLMTQTSAVVIDQTVTNNKTNIINIYTAANNELSTLTSGFSTMQSQLYSTIAGGVSEQEAIEQVNAAAGTPAAESTDTPQTTEPTIVPAKHINRITIIYGAIIGLLLGFVINALRYMYGLTVKNIEDIRNITSTDIVAELRHADSSKKLLRCIDRLVDRIKYHGRTTTQADIEYTAMNIGLICRSNNTDRICICTTLDKEDVFMAQVAKAAMTNGIMVTTGCAVNHSVDTMKKAAEAGYVLLWEQTGRSEYEQINKAIELCAAQGIRLLGTIAVSNE